MFDTPPRMPDERCLMIDAYCALIDQALRNDGVFLSFLRQAELLRDRLVAAGIATVRADGTTLSMFGIVGYSGGEASAAAMLANWRNKALAVRAREAVGDGA